MKNLADDVDDDKLREVFAEHGTITSCRVMRTPEGASRGFGFVCFSQPEEATKAVGEMSSQMVNGNPIYVALAQRKEVRQQQLEQQYMAQRGAAGMAGRGGFMQGMMMSPNFGNGMPGMAQQRLMFNPAIMPRGMARGPMAAAYARQQGMMNQQGMFQQGMQGGNGRNGQPGNNRNGQQVKFNQNARNNPQMNAQMQQQMMLQQQQMLQAQAQAQQQALSQQAAAQQRSSRRKARRRPPRSSSS